LKATSFLAGPFIGGLTVDGSMNASVGDYVTPGTPLEIKDDSDIGGGIHSSEDGHIATITGTVVNNSGVISVESPMPSLNIPKMGDIFIGEVNRLNEKTAEVKVLHIESNEDGHRSLPAERMFADIFVSELVDRFIPSAGDSLRKRDIIRAKIIKVSPMLKATTKGDPTLGVLHALCPPCGEVLTISDQKPDFNVACPRCDYRAFRALSNGFGHGFTIPDGSDLQNLNRSGQRWSKEAEPFLGHDGARPYLSPVADHRRGWSHEIPASAKRTPSRGGGRGGGPRREMFPTTCTLCAKSTEVPFKPTPGKPIRCRDCMSKVESGAVDKKDLAREREVMKSARADAEKSHGVKLFVGGVSYDATEEELTSLFATHGKLKEVHMAIDSDTGRPRGFAFVTFADRDDAKKAIKSLNNSEMKGRRISVEESNSSGRNRSRKRKQRR